MDRNKFATLGVLVCIAACLFVPVFYTMSLLMLFFVLFALACVYESSREKLY